MHVLPVASVLMVQMSFSLRRSAAPTSRKRSHLNRSELMPFKCQWLGWLLYFCVDMGGLVYMRESWRLMGAG